MSKSNMFYNKQLIHVASEMVVLTGLTFYFSSKNRKLMGHIEDLAQRLEDQEDHIQKIEQTLNKMTNVVRTRFMNPNQNPQQREYTRNKQNRRRGGENPNRKSSFSPSVSVLQVKEIDEESSDEDSDELDSQIQEELEELEELEEAKNSRGTEDE